MKNWEYDPIPRYYFFLGETCLGEVVFDGFQRAACNEFSDDGEVWRAIVHGELIGRFASLQDAQGAVKNRVLQRGLSITTRRPLRQRQDVSESAMADEVSR